LALEVSTSVKRFSSTLLPPATAVLIETIRAILNRFIQMGMPLLPLKPMAQLQRGVPHMLEARVHPLVVDIPRFIQRLEEWQRQRRWGDLTHYKIHHYHYWH
jgi:hypothetical protein